MIDLESAENVSVYTRLEMDDSSKPARHYASEPWMDAMFFDRSEMALVGVQGLVRAKNA
jgi:hypothetical protein